MLAERFPYAPRAALPYRHLERRKKRRQSRLHISLPRMGKGDRVSGARVLSLAAQMHLSFPCTTIGLSYHVCPIRPCGAPSPRGEGCDTRIPSSKKKVTKPPPYNKAPSTSVGMTGGRRVISHSLSHRCVDPSCAFGAGRLASQEGALMGRLGASLD